jgi:hypothetical protein
MAQLQFRWADSYSNDDNHAFKFNSALQCNGNEVLASLYNGSHNLTIFGETFVGGLNGHFNETVSFTVNTSNTPTATPFPASLLFVASVGIAIAAIGLFVYIKKRKH